MAEIENAVKPPEAVDTMVIVGKAIAPTSTADDRMKMVDVVNKKITNDKEGHINTQMQLVPMIGALLGGNLKEAYNYYNGGPTRTEAAIHPILGEFQREYNQRGPTGRIFSQNGEELDAATIKKLDQSGGLISNTDRNAFYTGKYAAATENQKAMMTGLVKPVADQYNKSITTAQQGSVIRNLLEDRRRLVSDKNNMSVLTTLSKLSPEQRQAVFGFVASQTGKTAGTAQETKTGESANVLRGQNVQGTISGRLGGGEGGGATSGLPSIAGVSASRSAGAMNQAQAAASTGETTGVTGGTSESIQRNVMSEINRITQGAIQTPEQFTALQRIVQNSQQIEAARASMKPEDMAPGVRQLAPVDPLLNSPLDVVSHDIDFQRNNSLNVAWNAYLAKKMHENITNIEPASIDKLRDEFTRTQTFKAIERTYDGELDRAKGRKVQPEEGQVYIDRKNRLRRWVDGDWEPINAR